MAECQEVFVDSENKPIQKDKEKVVQLLKEFSYYFIRNIEKSINLYRNTLEENPEKNKNSKTVEAIGGAAPTILGIGKVLQRGIKEGENSLKHIDIKSKASNLANLITNYSLQPDKIRMVLIESALYIFYSYETQFLQVTCEKGSDSRAMMKLAEDASERVLDYLITHSKDLEDEPFSRNLVTKGLFEGKSSLSSTTVLRCMKRGRSVTNIETNKFWTTNDLFEQPEMIFESPNNEMEFYDKSTKKIDHSAQSSPTNLDEDDSVDSEDLNQFGYRRAFPWENTSKIRENYVKKLIVDGQPKFILNKNDFATHYSEIQNYVINRNLNNGNFGDMLLVMHKALNSIHTNTEKILKYTAHIQEKVQVIPNNQEDNSNLVLSVNNEELGHAVSRIQDNTIVNDLTIYLDSLMRQGINSGSKTQEFMSDNTSKATTPFKFNQEDVENLDKFKSLVASLRENYPEMDSNKRLFKKALYGLVDWAVDLSETVSKKDDNDDDDETDSGNSQ